MNAEITIESGSNADDRVLYAREPLGGLPLTAHVAGIEVEVSVSNSPPNTLEVALDYDEDTSWEPYATGEDIFKPIAIADLPVEFYGIVRIDVDEDDPINEYSGDVNSYTIIDDFEGGQNWGAVKETQIPETEGEIDFLNELLGKTLVAYSREDDKTMLKFEDGTVLEWSGPRSLPLNADEVDLKEIWEEEANWIEK